MTNRSTLVRYLAVLVGMLVATGISLLIRRYFGNHSAVSIAYLVTILASAWWGGYGPGLLACSLGLFAAPFIFTPDFQIRQTDVVRDLLVFLVSLLISYVGAKQNALATALRIANSDLEAAVQDRTKELQRSYKELEKVNEALKEFAYSASHDLQQPLRMMLTYSQLLLRNHHDNVGSEGAQYLDNIVRGARQMDALLKDLLTYSLAVNTTVEIAEVVEAKVALQEAMAYLDSEIKESRATVLCNALPSLRMQSSHLLQIFQNLIGNALKYRADNPPIIEIAATREDEFWKISVSDNGIGIPMEQRDRVFGLFKRLHSSTDIPGTGVGLTICRRLVERYGGEMGIDESSSGGTCVYFTVPDPDTSRILQVNMKAVDERPFRGVTPQA